MFIHKWINRNTYYKDQLPLILTQKELSHSFPWLLALKIVGRDDEYKKNQEKSYGFSSKTCPRFTKMKDNDDEVLLPSFTSQISQLK